MLALAAAAAAQAGEAKITVDAAHIVRPISPYLTGACIEDVNHEIYGGLYSQMIFGESFQEPAQPGAAVDASVSGMWKPVRLGEARGGFFLEKKDPFVGAQSQQITLHSGPGEVGVANQGLNHWGMNLIKGKPYQGCVWARSFKAAPLWVSLESADGATVYATKAIGMPGPDWQRLDFTITPTNSDPAGRFAITLKQSGSADLGYAFLEPGDWGLFKGLPVRKDVADGLLNEGVTALRYGGSLVNADEYRWKNMIGERGQRPPYRGTWYPYSSDGWGIFDFLDFCHAAGILGIPAVNMNESPADMAAFVQHANAGRCPCSHLTHLELGNEEKINEDYWKKFKPMAEAIWAADPDIILVVGDFHYDDVINDPNHFSGGAVSTLAWHKKILDLAKEHDREVWFDVHIWTDAPPPKRLAATSSFIDQLGKLSPGAKYRVAIFEFNANNHALKRALANAGAILQIEQIGGKLPVACSANGLQPDGQNDNGWDQGLLFLDPGQVWLQPPGWVTRMISRHYEPLLMQSSLTGAGSDFQIVAARSQEYKTLVLLALNTGDTPVESVVHLDNFSPSKSFADVEQLTGPLESVNTAQQPNLIRPTHLQWQHDKKQDSKYSFPAHSLTIITFE